MSPMMSKSHKTCKPADSKPPPPSSRSSSTRRSAQPFFVYLLSSTGREGRPKIRVYYRNRSRNPITQACESATPAGLAPLHEGPPTLRVDLDPKPAGGRANALPGRVALRVGDALDLVESRDRVAHVARVG